MRRREFITLFGGVAAAWPLAARAQHSRRKRPVVGFLGGASFDTARPTIDAFLDGMRELGHLDGRSIDIEYRFANGDLSRLPDLARQLVQIDPDVILAAVTPSAVAARQAAPTIPVVCPVLTDLSSLATTDARPDLNVTGIRQWVPGLAEKLVELARELVPGAVRIGLLVNVTGQPSIAVKEMWAVGAKIGSTLVSAEVRKATDLESGFQRFVAERIAVAVVPPDSLFFAERHRIAKLAAAARVPAIYGIREHVLAGGLTSYGVDFPQSFRRAAMFVDKILKGARPIDLPIEFPTKVLLSINLKAANALGLEIPPTLLARADEVIE